MESISEGPSSGYSTFLAYRAAAEATGRVCLIRSNTSTANYRQVQKYSYSHLYIGNLNLKHGCYLPVSIKRYSFIAK